MGKASSQGKKTAPKGMTLGLGAFEKISAVEGIRLSGGMKRDLQALDRSEMTAAQRSRFIADKYGKKSA